MFMVYKRNFQHRNCTVQEKDSELDQNIVTQSNKIDVSRNRSTNVCCSSILTEDGE